MSLSNPIGGFLGLELNRGKMIWEDATLLNSGRSCLEYVLRSSNISKLYVPYYTCSAVIDTIEASSVAYELYPINSNLEPVDLSVLDKNDYFLYTNYFGIKDVFCRHLNSTFGERLIIDASQALFMSPPENAHTFYSPRKFVGVPDGGMLYTKNRIEDDLETAISYDKATYLMKRIDREPEESYKDFLENEARLAAEGIKKMSLLTRRVLESIDYDMVKSRRLANFQHVSRALDSSNLLKIDIQDVGCPMVYPYLVKQGERLRKLLIERRVFVPHYWPNVVDGYDGELASNIVPLPIDQRYDENDMDKVIEIINEYNN
jgi:hypothetical protein